MIKTELILLNYNLAFTSIFNKEENIIILENFISAYLEISLKEIRKTLSKKLRINMVKAKEICCIKSETKLIRWCNINK